MSHVMSLRFQERQIERLRRFARRLGRTPSESGALLVEEGLRRAEFGLIDFRDSPVGRQAYLQGSGLAVWEVILVARAHGMDPQQTAAALEWPQPRVRAALQYADAFPEEIEASLEDQASYDAQTVMRMLPQASVFQVPREESAPAPRRRRGAKP